MTFLIVFLFSRAALAAPAVSTHTAVVPEATIILSATGDIRLDGPVGRIAARDGAAAPSQEIRELLAADVVFGNLETAVTKRGTKTPKTWNFRAEPAQLAILRAAGYTVLNLANNHVWDYGEEGFLDTLKHVKKAGFQSIGGAKTRAQAGEPLLIRKNGITLGLLGMTSTSPKEAWAGPHKPGVLYSDDAKVRGLVSAAKARCDVLVVSFHGGTELAELPNDIQKSVARAAVDGGADLFLGHHPHVLQPVELHNDKPILYSLGNFLFVSPSTATAASVIVRAYLSKTGVERLELLPVDVNQGRLKPADAALSAQARAALNRLGALDARPDLLVFP